MVDFAFGVAATVLFAVFFPTPFSYVNTTVKGWFSKA